MDEAAHKIEAPIDRTDWREQFRARPHMFLGGAIVGGALLAAVLRPKSWRQVFDSSNEGHLGSVSGAVSRNGADAQEQALELWNNVKGALIGVAAMRITGYISELIPGFDEHLRRAEQSRTGRAFYDTDASAR